MPRIRVSDIWLRLFSRQLGGPSGPLGPLVARILNRRNAPRITAAVAALGLSGSEKVADIGFGGGFGLQLLLDATNGDGRVHGVEPSAAMLTRAGRTWRADVAAGHLELHQATMDALPFADGALDGWISLNTVYFIDDLPAAFGELKRVLAPTGRGVIGIGDPDWMARQPFTRHGFTLRPVSDVLAALEAAGLTTEHRTVGHRDSPFHLLAVGR